MRQYETFELVLQGKEPEGSQVDVDVTAQFTLGGKTTVVKGFYAGNGTYKVRYYPELAGQCHYEVKGLAAFSGNESCEKAAEGSHGIVRADNTHFRYADQTWFYPFGTTVYALAHQDKALIDQTMETLKTAPFNKVRMCVFPKDYDYNHNEPDYYAFEKKENQAWDVHKPCFAFWDALEDRIRQLDSMGIQCDLIVFHPYDRWGFSKLSLAEALVYLDYLTRRLSAFPNIWWSLANEFDLMEYSDADWKAIAEFIHSHDLYGHLLSNHNCLKFWDFADKNTTHICLQIKSVDKINDTIEKYQKPLMVDECCYEGNLAHEWGNISGFEMVTRFWKSCVMGGYCTHGETFLNEEEILWWSRGGKLKGESPKRIGFLREIIEALPGPLTFAGNDLGSMTKEKFEAMKASAAPITKENLFTELLFSLPWEEIEKPIANGKQFLGCYKDQAYLQYYDRHCTCVGTLNLPEEGKYNLEVIDAWEMTRTPLLQGVSGKTEFKLPGKEGIAVLALKVS
jgi:hypothetical protein